MKIWIINIAIVIYSFVSGYIYAWINDEEHEDYPRSTRLMTALLWPLVVIAKIMIAIFEFWY